MNEQKFYQFQAKTLDGKTVSMESFKGKVALVVNVASKCGYTYQYEGLEKLYRDHAKEGFVVLGFPCNQFGHQEPGNAEEIKAFCSLTYQVTFPLFAKIDVNGPAADPLYEFLKREKRGFLGTGRIKWNFTKFLVDREGKIVARFGPQVKPAAIEAHIKKLL